MKKIIIYSILFLIGINTTAQTKKTVIKKPIINSAPVEKETYIEIWTDYGIMVAKLYNQTPLHRDNFIKLIKEGFYDSLLWHRVIDGFMIQGGDPNSKNAVAGTPLGMGSAPGERIPAEFKNNFFHKKGALAAARDGNPEKASSNCQFYIVQGKQLTDEELNKLNNHGVPDFNSPFAYSKAQKEIYKRLGGTPFLDQNYTVFGEVISGLQFIDAIAKAPKDQMDRPLTNIKMKIRLLN